MKQKNKKTSRGHWQLNAIGAALLCLLAFSAWWLCAQGGGWQTTVPLALIAYAAFVIIYELTWNRANVPTLATGFAGRRKIAALLQQDAGQKNQKNYTVIDLGSGRGELTRRIARAVEGSQVIGIENARIAYWHSLCVSALFGPGNVSYRRLDFWPYDCTGADAIVFFLNHKLAQKAGEKLDRELRPGSMVISYNFPLLGAWNPIEVLEFRTPFKETIFVYRKA